MDRARLMRYVGDPATRMAAVAGLVAVLVIAQFVLAVGGVVTAHREVDRALQHSLTDLTDRAQERVERAADGVAQTISAVSALVEDGDAGDTELHRLLAAQLAAQPAVGALWLTSADGASVRLERTGIGRGYSARVVRVDEDGLSTYSVVTYDATLVVVDEQVQPLPLDTVGSPVYQAAEHVAGLVWVDPLVDQVSGEVEWWAASAVRDKHGVVVAVVAATLSVPQITGGLDAVAAETDGNVVLLREENRVVAVHEDLSHRVDDVVAQQTRPAKADDLGIALQDLARATDGDVFGRMGELSTLERAFSTTGAKWVIHVSASSTSLSQGYAALATTVTVVLGVLVPLTLALAYLLFAMWGPVSRMREGAQRDPLTGLANRRCLEMHGPRLLREARRANSRVMLAILDLDNFKSLNDSRGHLAGDQALASIASSLAAEVRPSDLAVRWGGDEFVVMVTLAGDDDPEAVVERIRGRVDAALGGREAGDRQLGVTAGYAVSFAGADSIDQLVARADAALVTGKTTAKGATYGTSTLLDTMP